MSPPETMHTNAVASDRLRALEALRLASATCTANLSALTARRPPDQPAPDLETLRKDFLSFLILLRQHSTKLALSLKPPPTYAASLTPLKDIRAHVSALTSCASRFSDLDHGGTLKAEVHTTTRDTLETLRALVDTFIKDDGNKDAYLVRTGGVYDVVDKAIGSQGLPADNLAAVRQRLRVQQATFDDSLNEVQEMIEDAENEGDKEEEGNAFGDGWDELGLISNKNLSPQELQRAKMVHAVLRLTTILHKRLLNDVFANNGRAKPPNDLLDRFPGHSSSLLAACDDLVATLYSPQDVQAVREAIAVLRKTLDSLCDGINTLMDLWQGDDLSEAIQKLSTDDSRTKKPADIRKWMEVCFRQIRTSCSPLLISE